MKGFSWEKAEGQEGRVLVALWFKGELRNKIVLGARSYWKHF
jgi:hypothetical protein